MFATWSLAMASRSAASRLGLLALVVASYRSDANLLMKFIDRLVNHDADIKLIATLFERVNHDPR